MDLPKLLPRVQAVGDQIKVAARAIGADNVRIFGSVARGEDQGGSDIDFLVDFAVGDGGLMPLLTLAPNWRLCLIDR